MYSPIQQSPRTESDRSTWFSIDSETPWIAFKSAQYNFNLRYPSNWTLTEDPYEPFIQLEKDGALIGGINSYSKPITDPSEAKYQEMYTSTSHCPTIAGTRDLSNSSQSVGYIYCLTGQEIVTSIGTWKGAVACSPEHWYEPGFDPNTCTHEFWLDTPKAFAVAYFNLFERIHPGSETEKFFETFLNKLSAL